MTIFITYTIPTSKYKLIYWGDFPSKQDAEFLCMQQNPKRRILKTETNHQDESDKRV